MAPGIILLVLRFVFLAALLAYVALALRQMIIHMPGAGAQRPPVARPPARPGRQAKPRPAPLPRPAADHPGAAQKRPPAALVVVEPGQLPLQPGTVIPLQSKTHIGRAPNNTVVLDDPHISRAHAFIGNRGDAWILVDKGSSNGTFLNGQRLARPAALRDGDVIAFGTAKFIFRLPPPQE